MMSHVKRIEAINDELIALRRELHAHPETGFQEFYTADVVARYLEASGYEVTTGIGGAGVMGLLRGAKPGRTFALRACLDALEIEEQTSVAYASQNPGCMHACGHDGNMTVTLGAAKILASERATLAGNIKVIMQPSEENTGGASAMIAARKACLPSWRDRSWRAAIFLKFLCTVKRGTAPGRISRSIRCRSRRNSFWRCRQLSHAALTR